MRSLLERLERHSIPEPNSGCWLWFGCQNAQGYGCIKVAKRLKKAHRMMFELINGPVPKSLTLDHLCKNTSCINPEHLEIVTLKENILRGNAMSARYAKRTHCNSGHEYNETNTRFTTKARICRQCHRLEYHRKKGNLK